MAFINPYSFVPLPPAIDRRRPAGHDTGLDAGGRPLLSGRIEVKMRLESPVHVGATTIYGSHLHGAVRSLHEALAGGCLRVFDPDALPVFRDLAIAKPERELAVVSRVEGSGGATEVWVQRQERVVDIELPALLRASSGIPWTVRTGARLDIDNAAVNDDDQVSDPASITFDPNGDYVLLVTETKARSGLRWWFKAVKPQPAEIQVNPTAVPAFAALAKGTDDNRPGRTLDHPQHDGEWVYAAVRRPSDDHGTIQGYRLVFRERVLMAAPPRDVDPADWLRVGTPVFVDVRKGHITGLSRSYFWRHAGEHPAGARVGGKVDTEQEGNHSLHPCRSWTRLCPSCRVFGSADVTAREIGQRADQNAYRGHVRFSDALNRSPLAHSSMPLPTGASPRPGAGQFYLENPSGPHTRLPAKERPPLREWGSIYDDAIPRRLRGRKFYWANNWAKRSARTSQAAADRGEDAIVLDAGQISEHRVVFENLARAELGGLLAALDPRLWFKNAFNGAGVDSGCLHVGGAKAWGLGVVTSCLTLEIEAEPSDRWLEATSRTPRDVDPFVKAFIDDVGEDVKESCWPALAHLLTRDFVVGEHVDYPDGFDFWKNSIGHQLRDERIMFEVLPKATTKNQHVQTPERQAVPAPGQEHH